MKDCVENREISWSDMNNANSKENKSLHFFCRVTELIRKNKQKKRPRIKTLSNPPKFDSNSSILLDLYGKINKHDFSE